MARVVITPAVAALSPGLPAEIEVEAANLHQLATRLDRAFPGAGAVLANKAALAIDGTVTANWSTALTPDSEVMVVPKISGG